MGFNPLLTTPSSAGALSPTTSMTGQLETPRGGEWSGAWSLTPGCNSAPLGPVCDLPKRFGIGDSPRPVNVQVSAAEGERAGPEVSAPEQNGRPPRIPIDKARRQLLRPESSSPSRQGRVMDGGARGQQDPAQPMEMWSDGLRTPAHITTAKSWHEH